MEAEAKEEKPKGGVALILGGGLDHAEDGGDDSAGEAAFTAFKKALDSGDAAKGFRAFKELVDAADTEEDAAEETADKSEDAADDLDL